MLRGDTTTLNVTVEDNARLGLITQGANRVYSPRPPPPATTTTVDSDRDDKDDGDLCQSQIDVTVGKNATFVYAPDPCSLYARSCFLQNQQVHVHPDSSVALIDWFSSGRYMNNERWEFDQLCTRTRLEWLEEQDDKDDDDSDRGITKTIPFLQDTIAMDLRFSQLNDYGAHLGMNCFASLILYGNDVQPVVNRCLTLSDAFASQYTRVRSRGQFHDSDDDFDEDADGQPMTSRTMMPSSGASNDCFIDNLINVSGTGGEQRRVVMGVSEVPCPGKPSDACVVRFAATSNEDLYRVFHHLLLPMSDSFGMEFYKERIRAQAVNIPTMVEESNDDTTGSTEKQTYVDDTSRRTKIPSRRTYIPKEIHGTNIHSTSNGVSSETFWSTLMLADSSLPTGSFAHSAGLEAAAQLGLITNEQDVEDFIQAASRSTMQIVAPFLIAGRDLAANSMMDDVDLTFQEQVQTRLTNQWYKINQECHAVMSTNGPACAASLDQGKSLARVASEWMKRSRTDTIFDDVSPTIEQVVLNCLKSSKSEATHIGPTLGLVGGVLGLDDVQVCRLFGYCMARDIVSAAVRLSLVGPLASVSLLHKVQYAAEDGIQIVLPLMEDCRDSPLVASTASAPVIEAVQPCHESLQVRLFRS